MKTEHCPLPDDYITNPEIELALIGAALRDKARELTGIREIGAMDTIADWIPVVQTVVDPGATSFLQDDVQLDREPNGPKLWGPPSVGEYDYSRTLHYMRRSPPQGASQSWFPVQNELEALRGFLAQTALSTSEDPDRNQQLEEFRRYLGAHAGLYYFLMHQDEGRVNIPQPFQFGPRFNREDWRRHLVAKLEPDNRGLIEKAKHLGEPRPGELDLGTLNDTEITVVAGGLQTIAVASRFARSMPGVRVTLVDTNVVGRYALQQFVGCLRNPNIRVATTTGEIQAAFDRSHGLFVSDVLADEPYLYDGKVQEWVDPTANVSSVNIRGLLIHAAARMPYGSPLIIQDRTPAVTTEPLQVTAEQLMKDQSDVLRELLARGEEQTPVLPNVEQPEYTVYIADPVEQIIPVLEKAKIEVDDVLTEVYTSGPFRVVARTGVFPPDIVLNDVDYITYENQLEPEAEVEAPQIEETPDVPEPPARKGKGRNSSTEQLPPEHVPNGVVMEEKKRGRAATSHTTKRGR